jgi:serine/threonine-protein phosphatase PP1 catalytic subunit
MCTLTFYFQDVFNCLPFCAIIGGKIMCMHGGLSPQLVDWNQIRNVNRPIDPPESSIFTDLLWSDPQTEINGWEPNPRGISFVFGESIVQSFCHNMDIDLIVR